MVGDAIKFANIFLNKLGAVEASSVIGRLERLLAMQQERVNTSPVLFDGAVSLGGSLLRRERRGWLAHQINRLFQPESPPARAATIQRFNIGWPGVPAAYPDFVP
jgi:hypothetical protein